MKIHYSLLLVAFALLPWAMGCPKPANEPAETGEHEGEEHEHEGEHGHSHADDDVLFWHRQDLEHEGYLISLGQHGAHLHTGHDSEPAIAVTKDGEPVADAKVFVTLLDDTGNVLTEEQATIYEPTTPEEPAHYAQAAVKVPKDAKKVTLRYRIELPDASEFSLDVPVDTETH